MAKPRQIRIEQRSALAAMQSLEQKSDEQLEAETKYRAAAQAILGARAAERYDAKAARAHFQRALAAARPQERMQLRRMADASLALAERRPDDLKQAVERLGKCERCVGHAAQLHALHGPRSAAPGGEPVASRPRRPADRPARDPPAGDRSRHRRADRAA